MTSDDRKKAAHGMNVQELYQQAASLQMQGRVDPAAELYEEILRRNGKHADSLHNLGLIRFQQGDAAQAEKLVRAAIGETSSFPEALNSLGFFLDSQDRLDEAAECYRRALAFMPTYPEASYNLGNTLQKLGKPDEAMGHFRNAIDHNPSFEDAHIDLGRILQSREKFQDAAGHFEKAVIINPQSTNGHNYLGNALQALGRLDEAIVAYSRALAIEPGRADILSNLGAAFHAALRPEEALACHQKAVALNPDGAELWSNLGSTLSGLNRFKEALSCLDRAVQLAPQSPDVHTDRGVLLNALGRLDQAIGEFETAIRLAPRKTAAFRYLSETRRLTAEDQHVAAMMDLSRQMGSLPEQDQVDLHFALGKVLADLADYPQSFAHLTAGNNLMRKRVPYDEGATLRLLERIQNVFSPELMRRTDFGDPSQVPVFIVGMPRSGTTLAEQILASHSKVKGLGETDDYERTVMKTLGRDRTAGGFPEIAGSMLPEHFADIGRSYVAGLEAAGRSFDRICNKSLRNVLFIGLIHLTLPNARIIHMVRDPVDTCLSCYSTLFAAGLPHTHDLAELGRYYRAHEQLMTHWRKTLPAGTMLDILYEDLIADMEGEARRMVAHCGLPWEDGCLNFHTSERAVRTASANQVRRPIYRTSVGRWKSYGRLLQPLLDSLGGPSAS